MNWFLDILTYDKTIGDCEERVILQHSALFSNSTTATNWCQIAKCVGFENVLFSWTKIDKFGHQYLKLNFANILNKT